jgi:ATP-binding protein involved in chromosome partitioning
MSAFECDHGETYALFGEGGGEALAEAIGAPLVGRIPIEPAVAAGNDAGVPVSLEGDGPAAVEFRAIAERLATEIAPPLTEPDVDMSGCSARMLDAVNAAFDDADAAKGFPTS